MRGNRGGGAPTTNLKINRDNWLMNPKQFRTHFDDIIKVNGLAKLAKKRRETWFRWEANPPKNWNEIKNKIIDAIVERAESARNK